MRGDSARKGFTILNSGGSPFANTRNDFDLTKIILFLKKIQTFHEGRKKNRGNRFLGFRIKMRSYSVISGAGFVGGLPAAKTQQGIIWHENIIFNKGY